tara:strand:- start:782 stop:2200 length:1419 start_codon:yes stop_codon:yes gene_type:complete
MNKLINKFGVFTISLVFLIVSCETVDFGDENVNPNSPTAKKTEALLTNAQTFIPSIVSPVTPNYYVQTVSDVTYTTYSRYDTEFWSYDSYYTGPLKDLQEILDLNENYPNEVLGGGSNGNQKAAAHIMMAYIYLNLTDRWGMVPYSEALKGSENVKPAHDSVESIYTSLFNNLDAAVNMMDNGGLNGDILFGGDMNQWVNMAAFIKMRMAMRIADVDSSTAQSKFLEAHSVLQNLNSSWNLHYPYLTSDSFDNPWQDRYESRYDFVVSEKLIDHLKATSDPRLPYMADGTVLSAGLEYVGLEYGLENPSTIETALSGIDSRIIYDGTSQGGWIFTYSEFAFMMADAYLRGWHNVGDAPTWTKIGIESSCVRWGVSAAAAASFAAAATVSGVNDIAEAVWTDMFLQGYEAWVQWRRYDYPVLLPPSAALTGTGVPVRNGYGTSMKVNNEASYKAAVAAQGPDTQDTKIWWDTK